MATGLAEYGYGSLPEIRPAQAVSTRCPTRPRQPGWRIRAQLAAPGGTYRNASRVCLPVVRFRRDADRNLPCPQFQESRVIECRRK